MSGTSALWTDRLELAVDVDVLAAPSADWLLAVLLSFFNDKSRTLSCIESREMWCTTPGQPHSNNWCMSTAQCSIHYQVTATHGILQQVNNIHIGPTLLMKTSSFQELHQRE